jgi:hypothetical protein
MVSPSIRSLSAAALAISGTAVLAPAAQAAPSTQAAKPTHGWRVTAQFANTPQQQLRLFDVAASNTRSAWAIGTFCPSLCVTVTPASYHWDGKRWTPAGITVDQVDVLRAVSTSGPTNTWAFGTKNIQPPNAFRSAARSLHWNGKSWTVDELPFSNPGIYGPYIGSSVTFSPMDTWAFGAMTTGATYLAHFDGNKWTQIAAPATLKPGGISKSVGLSKKDIWVLVDERQGYDLLHYNGKSWTIVTTPVNFLASGGALVVRSKNDIWLGGTRPASGNHKAQAGAMHFNGKKWSFVPVKTNDSALYSIADDGQGGLWAVTDNSPAEIWHDVKGHWSKVTPANIKGLDMGQLSHIPGGSTTLGIGTDSKGPAIFVTGT